MQICSSKNNFGLSGKSIEIHKANSGTKCRDMYVHVHVLKHLRIAIEVFLIHAHRMNSLFHAMVFAVPWSLIQLLNHTFESYYWTSQKWFTTAKIPFLKSTGLVGNTRGPVELLGLQIPQQRSGSYETRPWFHHGTRSRYIRNHECTHKAPIYRDRAVGCCRPPRPSKVRGGQQTIDS